METEAKEELRQIMRRIVAHEIPIDWASRNMMPAVTERRGFKRGAGGEFETIDEFKPGDDPRRINWRATARTGTGIPLKRVDLEPRDANIVLVADISKCMQFGTARTFKLSLLAEAAGSICQSAAKTDEQVQLITFNKDRIGRELPRRRASTALYDILATILGVSTSGKGKARSKNGQVDSMPKHSRFSWLTGLFTRSKVNDDSATNSQPGIFSRLTALFTQPNESENIPGKSPPGKKIASGLRDALLRLPANRSLVFVLSDFNSLTDAEKKALGQAAAMHNVVCLVVQDIRERELPAGRGFNTYQDMETGENITIYLSDKNRQEFAAKVQQRQDELFAFFKKIQVDNLIISTEEGEAAVPKMMRMLATHRR